MNSVVLWNCVLVVLGVFCVGADEVSESVSVMAGDSVTLRTDVKVDQNTRIKWYFNDTRIAEVTEDLIKICTDVQCNVRFRDRLKLDHQTGSLTIMDTRTTDSGLYTQEIYSYRDREKTFKVTVNVSQTHMEETRGVIASKRDELKKTPEEGKSDSHLSSGAVAGICVGVGVGVLAAAVAGVIYYRRHQAGQNVTGTGTRTQHSNQVNDAAYSSVNCADNELEPAANELSVP